MTQQRLHSQLAPIDLLTREELEQELHKGIDASIRERYRGLELQRFPNIVVTASATTQGVYTTNDQTPAGPEQGDIWMVRRIIVKGYLLNDTARYQLFRGSTPSDTNNGYTGRFLLEGFAAAVTQPTPSSPGIGASPSEYVNTNNYPVNVAVAGGTVTAIAVNGQTLTGITSGTFTLQPGAYITITYTVAPTTYSITNASANVPAGQLVGVGFYPGTKAIFLQPGEQIYAQVQGATIGNQYLLDGEAIRIPAEMKGKIL